MIDKDLSNIGNPISVPQCSSLGFILQNWSAFSYKPMKEKMGLSKTDINRGKTKCLGQHYERLNGARLIKPGLLYLPQRGEIGKTGRDDNEKPNQQLLGAIVRLVKSI